MDDNNVERYGGSPVQIGGKTYLLAPMSIGAMKRFRKAINQITAGEVTGDDAMDTAIAVVRSSLQRNYPDMTTEHIEENLIDLMNYQTLFKAVLDASGFVSMKTPGKAKAGSRQN